MLIFRCLCVNDCCNFQRILSTFNDILNTVNVKVSCLAHVKQLQVIVTIKEFAKQEWSNSSICKFFFRCGFVFKVDLTNCVFTPVSLLMIFILNSRYFRITLFTELDATLTFTVSKMLLQKASAERNKDISFFCCRRMCMYEGIRIDVSSMIQVRWALMSNKLACAFLLSTARTIKIS